MRELLSLLKSKSRCLKKMLDYSEEFLVNSDNSTQDANLERVLELENKREIAIRTLSLIERNITECAQRIPASERTPAALREVEAWIQKSVSYIHEIVITDGLVMKKVESIQTEISRNLLQSRKQHDTIGKFKSTWVSESGVGIDKKL